MTRRVRVLWVLGVLALIGISVLLFLWCSGPVLYEFVEASSPVVEPAWAIMNPIRDKSPEETAEVILRKLNEQKFDEAFSEIRGGVAYRIQAREREYPIANWRLVRRRDSEKIVELTYMVTRKDTQEYETPVRMTVAASVERNSWDVQSFRAVY